MCEHESMIIKPYFSTYPPVLNQTCTGINGTESVHNNFIVFCPDRRSISSALFEVLVLICHHSCFPISTSVLCFCILAYVNNINIGQNQYVLCY